MEEVKNNEGGYGIAKPILYEQIGATYGYEKLFNALRKLALDFDKFKNECVEFGKIPKCKQMLCKNDVTFKRAYSIISNFESGENFFADVEGSNEVVIIEVALQLIHEKFCNEYNIEPIKVKVEERKLGAFGCGFVSLEVNKGEINVALPERKNKDRMGQLLWRFIERNYEYLLTYGMLRGIGECTSDDVVYATTVKMFNEIEKLENSYNINLMMSSADSAFCEIMGIYYTICELKKHGLFSECLARNLSEIQGMKCEKLEDYLIDCIYNDYSRSDDCLDTLTEKFKSAENLDDWTNLCTVISENIGAKFYKVMGANLSKGENLTCFLRRVKKPKRKVSSEILGIDGYPVCDDGTGLILEESRECIEKDLVRNILVELQSRQNNLGKKNVSGQFGE